uniref:Nuclear pore complex protein Nup88 n=1 Tax=Plectus sambesii TaxID=2011161 RepID=A0A914UW92_9BILA
MGTLDLSLNGEGTLVLAAYRDICFFCFDGECLTAVFGVEPAEVDPPAGTPRKLIPGRKVKLSLSYVPLFKVKELVVNETGSNVALVGNRGVAIVAVPEDFWIRRTSHENYKSVYNCRCDQLDTDLFRSHQTMSSLKAKWHPGSPTDSHLVILCSDSVLRIYDTALRDGTVQPWGKVDMNLSFDNACVTLQKSGTAKFGLANAAVSFDFGPLVSRAESTPQFPIFVLTKDGDVYGVLTDLLRPRAFEPFGPIRMSPPAEDNYGVDACDLLCLADAAVPLLCVCTTTGLLYHCVIVEAADEELASTANGDYELFVYDCVELELKLSRIDLRSGEQTPYSANVPLLLVKDSSCTSRYLAQSPGGVHTVDVSSWTRDIADSKTSQITDRRSAVEYRLCSQLNESTASTEFISSASVFKWRGSPDALLVASMSTGAVFVDSIDKMAGTGYSFLQSKTSDGLPYSRGQPETMEEVQRILARHSTMPVFRSSEMLSEQQSAEVFLRVVQTLNERLSKQKAGKDFLDQRAKTLGKQRTQQRTQMADVDSRCGTVIDQAAALKQKTRALLAQQQKLDSQLQMAVDRINRQRGPLSLAEQEMLRSLERMQIEADQMNASLKQLSSETTTLRKVREGSKREPTTPRNLMLEKSQDNVETLVSSIKALQDDVEWLNEACES